MSYGVDSFEKIYAKQIPKSNLAMAKRSGSKHEGKKGAKENVKAANSSQVSPSKVPIKEITNVEFTPRPAQWRDPEDGEAVHIRNILAHTKVSSL